MATRTKTRGTEAKETILLKSDKLGRVRQTKEQWEALLDEFDRAGMSGQAFARWEGIKYPTFAQTGSTLDGLLPKSPSSRGS